MLSQCFSDPTIFSHVGTDHNKQVISCRIVGVEEVVDQAHQAKAAGDNDKLIFGAKLLEQVLLIFLGNY